MQQFKLILIMCFLFSTSGNAQVEIVSIFNPGIDRSNGYINVQAVGSAEPFRIELWRGDTKVADPIEQQDGVAAQISLRRLKEISEVTGNREFYGRAFIPPQEDLKWRKNFLNSHSEGNYSWIFTHLDNATDDGHVTPK